MPDFSSIKIINHRFHVNYDKVELVVGYDIIIGRDLMIKIALTAYFQRQSLKWYVATVPIKEPSGLLGKLDLSKHEMREVLMHTAKPASTKEATEILVKILFSTYVK